MASPTYSRIYIIYNPNSTSGVAERRAHRLHDRLKRRGLKNIELVSTKYAGHAEEIAYAAAAKYKQPLLVSVSGDGGYNEVINGALKAQDEDAARHPVCAILAAGNANDHRRTVRKRPLAQGIIRGNLEPIDVLRMTANAGTSSLVRYAHSYIGFGFTSAAAEQLNKQHLTRWKEIKVVARTLLHFKFFNIILPDGTALRLDSLVFANIHRMSKMMRLGKKTDLHNGGYFLAMIEHLTLIERFFRVVWIALFGLNQTYRLQPYQFTIPDSRLAHFDGEVTKIAGGSDIRVEAVKEKLLTIR
jgi:diacylglycerol kinase (ATP)